jgi:hypothetical protein
MSGQKSGLLASFDYLDDTIKAIKELRRAGHKDLTVYAPLPEHHIEEALGYGQGPVRTFTLVGALTGTATALAFTTWTAMDWPLVVGGKPMLSIPAFVIIMFEMTILFGALSTVIGLFINTRLPHTRPLVVFDPEFSGGRFGIYAPAAEGAMGDVRKILESHHPAELREDREGLHG